MEILKAFIKKSTYVDSVLFFFYFKSLFTEDCFCSFCSKYESEVGEASFSPTVRRLSLRRGGENLVPKQKHIWYTGVFYSAVEYLVNDHP